MKSPNTYRKRVTAMKRILWFIPALLLGFCVAEAEIVDRIVAKVNDDIITLSELNRSMAQARQQLAAKYTGQQLNEMVEKTKEQILNNLIETKLITQKAVELGYDATVESAVSSEVQRIMKENNLPDTEALENALAQQGMNVRQLREQIQDALMGQYLVNDFVRARITLLTPEIEKYYKDHTADFTTPEEVTLSEIIIPISENGSAAETQAAAETRANDLYRRLQQGEPFSALASQYSKGPTANKGGNIGTFKVADINDDMRNAIKGLKEGDVSPPQKADDSYVLYHIDSRKYASLKSLEEVRDEIKDLLYREKFNPEFDRFIAKLKEDAYIQIYSESE
jgi:peptidyl-prolyl cis-trans isomerase SurA